MGVTKETIAPGNGTDIPRAGDHVAIHYTGALYDPSKKDNHNMGFQFDTSKKRGPLKIPIGVKRVIPGWDEGVLQMSLGEEAILTITEDYAYGRNGFPGLIPPHSDLVFKVHLVGVGDKSIESTKK